MIQISVNSFYSTIANRAFAQSILPFPKYTFYFRVIVSCLVASRRCKPNTHTYENENKNIDFRVGWMPAAITHTRF